MHHCDKFVPVFENLFNLFKAKFETFGFTKIKFFVVRGIVGTARTRPPAGTADYNISELDAIVLQKIKSLVGRALPQLSYTVPPIVVVAPYKYFFPAEIFKPVQIEQPFFQNGAPAYISAD